MGDAGALPKILVFILSSTAVFGLVLRLARGKDRRDDDEAVSMVVMWVVDGGGPGGLSEPSGITIRVMCQKSWRGLLLATCGEAAPSQDVAVWCGGGACVRACCAACLGYSCSASCLRPVHSGRQCGPTQIKGLISNAMRLGWTRPARRRADRWLAVDDPRRRDLRCPTKDKYRVSGVASQSEDGMVATLSNGLPVL